MSSFAPPPPHFPPHPKKYEISWAGFQGGPYFPYFPYFLIAALIFLIWALISPQSPNFLLKFLNFQNLKFK